MKHTLWKKIKCFPDVISGVILFAVCCVFYTQLGEIKQFSSLSDSVGPRFFPKIVLIVLMALAVGIAITGIPSGRKRLQKLKDETPAAAEPVPENRPAGNVFLRVKNMVDTNPTVRSWISILGIFFFILLMKPLGFAISGALYLFVQFSLLAPPNKRKLWLYAIIAVAVSFGAYLLFRYAVHINLPAGLLKYIL